MTEVVDNPSQVMQAVEGFATDIDGVRYVVNSEFTRVAADHPLVKRFPQHFRPVEDSLAYRTEEATDNPGEQRNRERPSKPSQAAKTPKES